MFKLRSSLVLAAGAIVALAAWPAVIAQRAAAPAASLAPAPVNRDYLRRDAIVAFEEHESARNPKDQITLRMLATQYLQRFREQGDIGDVARAQAVAERSIVLQPQGNTAAQMSLASALLSYHDFRAALGHEQAAIDGEPFNQIARAQKASLLMEIGEYSQAARILALRPRSPQNPTWDAVLARYDELTGRLDEARLVIRRATRLIDSLPYVSAYDRSWYHMRAAQLACEAGDAASAEHNFSESLRLFPDNSMTLLLQAGFFRAQKRWRPALEAATRSADIYPLPQALGYKADAQRALGDAAGAQQTDELIVAEERLFNVQGINDRLLANYFAQRHMHLNDALRAARADYQKRGDEIYADDTLGWVLAAMGRWNQARFYALRATRFDTQDPLLEYHAGVIALHTGHVDESMRRLRMALALNPRFDSVYADHARALLRRSI